MIPQTFIFIGRSGAGKGTQAELLSEYLKRNDDMIPQKRGIFRLETGLRFRQFIQNKTYTSELAKKIYIQGGLLPEFLSIYMWANDLSEKLKSDEHIILDGTPRKLREALVLESALVFYNRPKARIIYVNISDKTAEKRLKMRGRLDDNAYDVRKRLNWFETEVIPTIEYYKKNNNYFFHQINGEQSIDKVHGEIIKNCFSPLHS